MCKSEMNFLSSPSLSSFSSRHVIRPRIYKSLSWWITCKVLRFVPGTQYLLNGSYYATAMVVRKLCVWGLTNFRNLCKNGDSGNIHTEGPCTGKDVILSQIYMEALFITCLLLSVSPLGVLLEADPEMRI